MTKELIVKSQLEDVEEVTVLLDAEGYYAEYNEEFNEFSLAEDDIDALENELEKLFIRNGIPVSYSRTYYSY